MTGPLDSSQSFRFSNNNESSKSDTSDGSSQKLRSISKKIFPLDFPQFETDEIREIGVSTPTVGLVIRYSIKQLQKSLEKIEEKTRNFPKEQKDPILNAIKKCRFEILRNDVESSRKDLEIKVQKATTELHQLGEEINKGSLDAEEIQSELERIGDGRVRRGTSPFFSLSSPFSSLSPSSFSLSAKEFFFSSPSTSPSLKNRVSPLPQ